MLLQLSIKHGLNTDNVTSWVVGCAYVIVKFTAGTEVTLNRNEGHAFLRHVECEEPRRSAAMWDILLGKGETDDQQVNAD